MQEKPSPQVVKRMEIMKKQQQEEVNKRMQTVLSALKGLTVAQAMMILEASKQSCLNKSEVK